MDYFWISYESFTRSSFGVPLDHCQKKIECLDLMLDDISCRLESILVPNRPKGAFEA